MGDTENKNVTRIYAKGDSLMPYGKPVKLLAVILSGTAEAKYRALTVYLQPGAVIGLPDSVAGGCIMEYTALENLELYELEYRGIEDLKQFFAMDDSYASLVMDGCLKMMGQLIHMHTTEKLLFEQANKYIKRQYSRYLEICGQLGCNAVKSERLASGFPMVNNLGNQAEIMEYYKEVCGVPSGVEKAFFAGRETVVLRHLMDFPQLMMALLRECEILLDGIGRSLNLLCSDNTENVFALYMSLLKNSLAAKDLSGELLVSLKAMSELREKIEQTVTGKLHMQMDAVGMKYRRLYENMAEIYKNNAGAAVEEELENLDSLDNVNGMLDKLLEFSGLDDSVTEEFREALQEFVDMPDRLSTENADRKIRKRLSGLFYKVYEAVFFRAERENTQGVVLDLFLNYGIADETLFKRQTLDRLKNCQKDAAVYPVKVYRIREWLHEIYIGNKEPSRNEFDQDYQEYLRELNKSRVDISAEEMERLNSREEKVRFEITNFLTMNNRLTSGHLLSFCPVLTEEDLGENFENQIVTAKQVNEVFQKLLSIDFSIFHRDVLYDDPDNGISKLMTHRQVLPDIICMPNAGTMGRMWQEISGRKRASAARFTVPLILKEDMLKITIRMFGSFRWEICKRVQGNYWNDVSEPSLTSEFFDYVQFYKKNRELSDKAKEKLAQLLVKCRNNYGEVFVNDYMIWIVSESAGNVRLDKLTRNIMGRYCPFTKAIRDRLADQPMFAESVARYERERMKKCKEMNNRRAAIRNCKGTETKEFLDEVAYWEL